MFWLTRPPYLRWVAAALLLVAAFVWDLRGRTGVPFPFAAVPIAAGSVIDANDVEWRSVPRGLMAAPDLSAPVASRSIAAGEPIVPSAVDGERGVPSGWWAVPVVLPAAATVGTLVRLIATEHGVEADGLVVAEASSDLLSISEAGLVAVPPEHATTIARAAFEGTVIAWWLLDWSPPRSGGDAESHRRFRRGGF